jgi:hypothetical protein
MGIRLFSCGDIVNSTNNQMWISGDLIKTIKSCDFAIGNLEAPIFTVDMEPISKAGPHIFQSERSIEYLSHVGFTHVSLANNHIYDFGEIAFQNTLKKLTDNHIEFVGAGKSFHDSYQPKFIEKEGLKIGLLAACENEFGCHYEDSLTRSGYAYLFHPDLEKTILKLKEKVNYIVLIAHAGIENISIPIKEWRDRYQRLCDLGVDVIIGHHPHVPQGYELYNNRLIFYSLGNFYFDTPAFIKNSDDSYSIILEFDNSTGITFDIIYHKKVDKTTLKVKESEVDFNIEHLNSLLGKRYLELNDKHALEAYDSYYKLYYKIAISGSSSLKSLFYLLFGKGKKQQISSGLLLLHNIRIDSHRFTVQRALSLRFEKYDFWNE